MLIVSVALGYVTVLRRAFSLLICCLRGRENVAHTAEHPLLASGKYTLTSRKKKVLFKQYHPS